MKKRIVNFPLYNLIRNIGEDIQAKLEYTLFHPTFQVLFGSAIENLVHIWHKLTSEST